MLKCNQSIFGVLNMMENNVNVLDMEKEQLKQIIKNLARKNNMTASDLATQAGVAPSTITGFLNNVPGRGHYGLSARTQSKISDAFPEFREQIEKPQMIASTFSVPIIGMWDADYRVNGLQLGMPSSFLTSWSNEMDNYSAVIRSPNFFSKLNLNTENRFYLFKNVYVDSLNETENKQVYATTEHGNFIGYQTKGKDAYYLNDFFDKRIEIAGKVLKASKIEWTRQV